MACILGIQSSFLINMSILYNFLLYVKIVGFLNACTHFFLSQIRTFWTFVQAWCMYLFFSFSKTSSINLKRICKGEGVIRSFFYRFFKENLCQDTFLKLMNVVLQMHKKTSSFSKRFLLYLKYLLCLINAEPVWSSSLETLALTKIFGKKWCAKDCNWDYHWRNQIGEPHKKSVPH